MTSPASRRRLLTFALAGLCVALAVLAFLPPPDPVPEMTGPPPALPLADNGTADTAIRLRAAGGPAFRRPLFVSSRRMPGGGAAIAGAMRLRAVFLGPGTKKALVETKRGREPVWVAPGENLAGWQVAEIHAESVVLRGSNGRRTLELEKPDAAPAGRRVRALSRPKRRPAAGKRERTSKVPE